MHSFRLFELLFQNFILPFVVLFSLPAVLLDFFKFFGEECDHFSFLLDGLKFLLIFFLKIAAVFLVEVLKYLTFIKLD
jgi:hypothetical protein